MKHRPMYLVQGLFRSCSISLYDNRSIYLDHSEYPGADVGGVRA